MFEMNVDRLKMIMLVMTTTKMKIISSHSCRNCLLGPKLLKSFCV